MRSLRFRLLGLWVLSLTASLVVGILLFQLFETSSRAQVERAQAVVARSCDLIRDRFGFYAIGWAGPVPALSDGRLRSDLATVVEVALARQEGVEGGIWQADAGSLAYAYPTYQGTGRKTDLPAAERSQIELVNQQAAHDQQPADHQSRAKAQTLLLRACPLKGPIPDLTAWVMLRVQSAAGLERFQIGIGVLFALMTGMSIWLARMLFVWGRHLRSIETELGNSGAEGIPNLSQTGEREFDRIIDALNEAGRRLSTARKDADMLTSRVARAERLAGLGRVAAGVAHEIRNPIAALRLQGENALAGDDHRRRIAITEMLSQVDRLNGLARELLAMTQRREPKPRSVELKAFLDNCIRRHADEASPHNVRLVARSDTDTAKFDADMVGRILDNLISNAVRHAPESGLVTLSASMAAKLLTITVEDTGAGVPDDIRDHLFEPFVTGRSDGTGLGLAIARELADAHGGRLLLRTPEPGHAERGAAFALELPQDAQCPRS